MAKGVNKAIILGNIGKIETKETNSGKLTRMSIATSEKWTDKASGQLKEQIEWHNIIVFGKLAEVCEKYLEKGSKVYIEGSIRTTKYQAEDGTDRYSTQIIAKEMQMLGKSQGEGKGNQPPVDAYKDIPKPYEAKEEFFDDDIPF